MKHEEQVGLLDELLGLRKQKSAFLDEAVTFSPVDRYLDEARFLKERQQLFRRRPVLIAHVSELAEDGAFLRRSAGDLSLLVTRDRDGEIRVFYNVCRHRGARLVDAEAGCRHRFTCPYHAWTWDNAGRLIGVPHQAQGFPDLDKESHALKQVPSAVRSGFVWVSLDGGVDVDIDAHLAPIADDLDWLGLEDLEVFSTDERVWNCNWKIVVEGGLESYHFRVAHAQTIAGLFHDNLSSYQQFGPHFRSILARRSIDELVELPRKSWDIRRHANVLYNIYPASALLVQEDHVVLIHFDPLAVDRTLIRCVTLIPGTDGPLTDKSAAYWERNHQLTVTTLNEDFALGESIQSGLHLGVNEAMTFGRFEGALNAVNRQIEADL
ncbi:SRPBCC family protein [Nitratireductor sp. XY-223]|uniref:aromatic ring-hydroxylating oxygenase subunit alpha n=1 Tax=Nitratireductor sp. XY-223 TaxID=2561926 RepID=UPI0010A9CE99|nr:SRPBCC family protein [Nitratireductor sp. XY-223]